MQPEQVDILKIVLNAGELHSRWIGFLCLSIGSLLLVKALRLLIVILKALLSTRRDRSSDEY
jgi:ascorbate-specific PTS system EIIC-type component UlaA